MILLLSLSWAETTLIVRDRLDGDPLVAEVVDAEGQVVARTDSRGRVSLDDPGDLRVLCEGYEEQPVPTAEGRVAVWLEPRRGDLEVVVEGLRARPHPSRHMIDAEMANETPGTLEDSVRLVAALPGVTVQRETSPTAGTLMVRGASPGESRYLLDGIEIPYLYHFNQYASVFPASQLSSLELFPSAMGASYGDAVGAIVDAHSDTSAPQATHGSASLNFVMVGGDVKTPMKDGWWVSASGRRSYQDLAGEATGQYTVWPVFHDYVLRAHHGDERNGYGAFVLAASDGYERAAAELDLLDPVEQSRTPTLAYSEGFVVGGGMGAYSDAKRQGKAVLAVMGHQRSSSLGEVGEEEMRASTLTSRWNHRENLPSPGPVDWSLDGGYELRVGTTALRVDDVGEQGVRVAEEAPTLGWNRAVDANLGRTIADAYTTLHAQIGHVRLMPAVRAGTDTSSRATIEPRAGARWQPSRAFAVKGGGGRYIQRARSEQLLGTPDLPITTSWQLDGGVEFVVAQALELELSAYWKDLQNPIFQPVDALPTALERGTVSGLEGVVRWRLRERWFFWGWAGVMRAVVEQDGQSFAADADQPWSGGIVASYDTGAFNVGVRYRGSAGLPFTPLEGSIYNAGEDAWVATPGDRNSDRLPNYHKLDLRLAYTWQLNGWSLTASAEVWMVPKSSAQLYPAWNYDYTEQDWVSGPTILPLVGVRAKF